MSVPLTGTVTKLTLSIIPLYLLFVADVIFSQYEVLFFQMTETQKGTIDSDETEIRFNVTRVCFGRQDNIAIATCS